MWQTSLRQLENGLKLPGVVEERCVHARVENASCRACVDVCPRGAWHLDDARLGLDTEACDGCGLCVAACPEGALIHDYLPQAIRAPEGALAFAACERAVAVGEAGEAHVSCLHALPLRAILALYRSGVHALRLAHEDCRGCPRAGGLSIFRLLEHLNDLLRQRQLPQIGYRVLRREQWRDALRQARRRDQGPRLSRRGFLRGALGYACEQGMRVQGRLRDAAEYLPPGAYIPSTPGQPVPFAPRFDKQRCSGCGLCARICPHEAIALASPRRDRKSELQVQADNCTGCGLCVDLCEVGALGIEPWAVSESTPFGLMGHRCRACGNRFYSAPGQTGSAPLCRICARTRHHRALFQVLD